MAEINSEEFGSVTYLTKQLTAAAQMSDRERHAFKLELIRKNLPVTTEGSLTNTPTTSKISKKAAKSPIVTLPPHPRETQRVAGAIMEAMQALLLTCCPQVPDIKSLINLWTTQRMGRYVSIMKIGFPVVSNLASAMQLESFDSSLEEVERVSLSKDGMVIEHYVDGALKAMVRMDKIDRVTLAEDFDAQDTAFNATSFTVKYGGGETLGPFTPPTDLELQSWYLVISTLVQQNSRHTGGVLESERQMFQNCATMVLGELARDPDLRFLEAYEIVRRNAAQIVSRFELKKIVPKEFVL